MKILTKDISKTKIDNYWIVKPESILLHFA